MTETTLQRVFLILLVAVGAHLATVLLQRLSARLLQSRLRSEAKAVTITGFVTSVLIFSIYFAAFGFLLSELGVSLTTYFASASVVGLAVSFGSQGVVQDVITGLTVVFSDLLDVGDMVEIGGQTGIVEHVGMRFTVLVTFAGSRAFVPNRSIANVINYPQGYVRTYLDVRLRESSEQASQAEARVEELCRAAYQQYPGVLLLPPTFVGRVSPQPGLTVLRVKFRIWPGQGRIIEEFLRQAVIAAMKELDANYADWMVTVHYRAEPASGDPARRLPRPSALRSRPTLPSPAPSTDKEIER